MITRFALTLALASCGMPPEILPATTGEESTSTGENSTGEDWGHSTTGDRDTTGSMGSPTSETTASGVPSTSDYTSTGHTSTGSTGSETSTGEPVCGTPSIAFCAHVVEVCVAAGLDYSGQDGPDLCSAYYEWCVTGVSGDTCETCDWLRKTCDTYSKAPEDCPEVMSACLTS